MLEQLVPQIQKTAEFVQDISAASREQDNGAAQINRVIQQLEQAAQETAAAAEELALGAEDFARQAVILQQTTAFFKTNGVDRETPVRNVATAGSIQADDNLPARLARKSPHPFKGPALSEGNGHPAGYGVNEKKPDDNGDDLDQEFEQY
jgi:methyl-accepting chemotaxis protein